MATNAAIYARISDDPQGRRAGVDRQRADCAEIAERRGWTVVETFIDNDISAYSGKPRPAYRAMLEAIEAGTINAVICWHLDRLTRHPRELEDFFETCDGAGVKNMATVTGDIDLGTDDGRFNARILGAVARKESDDKSRRVARAMFERAKNGLPMHPNAKKVRPFGYELDHVTVKPDEASLIREAATRLMSGDTLSGICREWNDRGLKTLRGKPWGYQNLKAIVTAPRVAGLVQHRGELLKDENGAYVRGRWEPILDEEEFLLLRTHLSDPARRTNKVQKEGRTYLLTGGVAHCAIHDAPLRARGRTRKGKKQRSYRCTHEGCYLSQVAEPLEEFVYAVIQEMAGRDVVVAALGEDENDHERALLDELRKIEGQLAELDDRYFDGVLDKERYLRQVERKNAQREKVKRELAGNGRSRVLAGVSSDPDEFRREWEKRGLAWRRAVVTALFEKVVVQPHPKRGRNTFDPSRVSFVRRRA